MLIVFFFPSFFQKPGFSSLDFAKQGVYSPVVVIAVKLFFPARLEDALLSIGQN